MSKGDPYLIIITGRPAAGKTTLAKQLAHDLRLPVVSKDNIREVLFDRLGWHDRSWAQALGRASVDLMFYFTRAQLEAGWSVILDNAFDPSASTPRFQAFSKEFGVNFIQVICDANREILFERFKLRMHSGGRHPGHGDQAVLDELWEHLSQDQTLDLNIGGEVIMVDTSDLAQINYQQILDQIKCLTKWHLDAQKGGE